MLKIKRVYEGKEADDGERILIDRLWPRGVSKDKAGLDAWQKELAPSTALRQWFDHDPEKWEEFKKRYRKELAAPKSKRLLEEIARTAERHNVTLIYSAKDTEHSDVRVLEELIAKLMSSVPD
jgi:uncharacterized protein YeaO (DUF488 family)